MTSGTLNPADRTITKRIANFLSSAQNELTVNISRLNFIEASRTALLNSAKCYAHDPFKKINWIVKDENVKEIIMPFKLKNMEILTK
ncbi:MAG: hypothetical protein LUE64_06865 [Candidatus Gastranaerophilales bacterium]|nr:hypothetical protein [Candidatus Gastranaerophilales bacterium]